MKVLTIGNDRKLFEEGSAVRARVIEYGKLFEELHVVVFSRRIRNYELGIRNGKLQIAKNVWIYPTNSWSRWFYIFDAIRIGSSVIENCLSAKYALAQAGKLKIENSPNDFVISGQDPFECGLAACKISKKEHLPLHIQIHTDFLSPYFKRSSFLNRIRVFIASRVLPKANAIRVVSERIKNSLLQTANYKLQTIPTILPIYTDLEWYRNTQASFDLKQKYPEWSFVIVAVGRFSPEKNFGFAIRVLKKLLKNYPKTGLVIIGEGPMKNHLERLVWWKGLSGHVVFEPWQNNLVSHYKTANLFLQTSLYEGFGLALLEAVASGLPAVSSDVGIAPELLNRKGHRFVCPVNDRKCFVRAISGLIEDNQLREFFSLNISPSGIAPFLMTKEKYLEEYRASLERAQA